MTSCKRHEDDAGTRSRSLQQDESINEQLAYALIRIFIVDTVFEISISYIICDTFVLNSEHLASQNMLSKILFENIGHVAELYQVVIVIHNVYECIQTLEDDATNATVL